MPTMYLTALDDTVNDDGGFNLEGSELISATMFMNALQVWHWAQNRVDVTVEEAAAAFFTTPAVIREAIGKHPWMYEIKGIIETDGA